ncbi:MAG: excinuclease ABC subunit UvrB [Candidatus Eisenbacteria bacterium]|uniref:UvrABC system protein B n=1 Tax=Eiseniibacteriota bacterium TaxID=2212470 RepID=A0A948WDT2_UNCEI|nr:excinuclease ABC subunit UvrB [Candidatus Eisenbacteria bacterium]MBU1948226.1 excinuclease ABC subunit UvrB [Candidatus Eisenbacteria bacterium]MBU2692153.1 excinuclease ABC subunit UvrB [Candidatus Eisenbacteria bacterium]
MSNFRLISRNEPRGDQPQAIRELTEQVLAGRQHQTLLGVTGSGKTFTIAHMIANLNRPTLVISHNKTLAAQLYGEFRGLFPENGVGYFVSYYDYYQPEAYVPQTDTYIEKDAKINDDIDRLRLQASGLLLTRRDVIIVASVSCIYGLGDPAQFRRRMLRLCVGEMIPREEIIGKLVEIRYERNDLELRRGVFRVRGDLVEIFPAHDETAYRVYLSGDEVERIQKFDPLTGEAGAEIPALAVFPATHFLAPPEQMEHGLRAIEEELKIRVKELDGEGKNLEAQRLRGRTRYDLEMLREVGYCTGIENYSRHLSGRRAGERPTCLLDYFPEDFITIIDESHVTIPQLGGMYAGDRSRKETLVQHGFRLPSALDNRPLKFDEIESFIKTVIYISATPAAFEMEKCEGVVVEQVIRPTGLIDPEIHLHPIEGQMDHLLEQVQQRTERGERVLITTLTKRMAEELADYLSEMNIRVRYIHSDVASLDRMEILRGLRLGEFDVLVGINLLREGLDLPEVSLVAILDADKEGFLRSERSLIQTAGRAARNERGAVILYADKMTDSMARAIHETTRRRKLQIEYNRKHGITPQTIQKTMEEIMLSTSVADARTGTQKEKPAPASGLLAWAIQGTPPKESDKAQMIQLLLEEMKAAADALEFEKAASLRDRLLDLQATLSDVGSPQARKRFNRRRKR